MKLKIYKDYQYWQNYYTLNKAPIQPSPFAEFIYTNYIDTQTKKMEYQTIIDIGCGNGRDFIYFHSKGLKVHGVDLCKEEINYLNSNFSNQMLKFYAKDFTELKINRKYDFIYSRFTLHSINAKSEQNLFNWINKSLNNNGFLCIEVRGLRNELYGLGTPVINEKNAFIYHNHYRRFIDINDLAIKINQIGLKILFLTEDINCAIFNNENYYFIRLIASL